MEDCWRPKCPGLASGRESVNRQTQECDQAHVYHLPSCCIDVLCGLVGSLAPLMYARLVSVLAYCSLN